MALPSVNAASYPTVGEVRDAYLRELLYACQKNGLTVNVLPGSEHYIKATALANRISPAIANGRIGLDDYSPLKATGTKLDELAGVYGVTRRAASSSSGYVLISCSGTVTIPSGYQFTAPSGKKYQTTSTNVAVSSGSAILVTSVDTGADTELDAGTIVTWDSASVGGLLPTATVDSGAIDGGADADNDDRLRARLITRLAFPAQGGNWSQVKAWAEESTSSAEAAYVYSGVRGPGSLDVAVTKEGGDRTLTVATTSIVSSYLLGKLPGHCSVNVTSVNKLYVDVIANMTLPLPVSAGGAGGGWRDDAPWPSTNETGVGVYAKVTAKNNTNRTITVDSTTPDAPTAGKHIAIWDYVNESLMEFTISSVAGSSGAYVLTVDNPVTNVSTGMYVSAGAFNMAAYCEEFLAQVQKLGPAEKTSSTDVVPRALRKPSPDVSNPASLTIKQLDAVASVHPEILNLEYATRLSSETFAAIVTPPTVGTFADPPRIFVLRHLSFRRTP